MNGVKHVLEASDEASLLAQENALYRQTMQPAATIQQIEQSQPRDTDTGRFVEARKSDETAAAEADRKAALQLQMQLGQIDIATYLEQSGAIDSYLEKAGVPMEDLRSAVQEKSSQRFEQSWKEGTDAFLSSPEGRNWPGGEENMNLVGQVIQSHLKRQQSIFARIICLLRLPKSQRTIEKSRHTRKSGLRLP